MNRDAHGVLRDDDGVELVGMPPGYLELLRDRDPFTLAVKTYEELLSLQPPRIPPSQQFSRPELIKLWRHRGIPVQDPNAGMGADMLRAEFMGWLENELHRSDVLDDARRRLRSTMWAEATLRASSRRPDAVAVLARFHVERWKVAKVDACAAVREKQIEMAIKILAKST